MMLINEFRNVVLLAAVVVAAGCSPKVPEAPPSESNGGGSITSSIPATEGEQSSAPAPVISSASVVVAQSSAPVSEWSVCATEGEVCQLSGMAEVRYGAEGEYITRILSGPITCSNQTFGDPNPGTEKNCEKRLVFGGSTQVSTSSATATTSSIVSTSSSVVSTSSEATPIVPDAAQGKILFNDVQLCAGCHLDVEDGGVEGSYPIDLLGSAKFSYDVLGDVADYIEASMPLGGVDDCEDSCAIDIAAYLLDKKADLEQASSAASSSSSSVTNSSSSVISSSSVSTSSSTASSAAAEDQVWVYCAAEKETCQFEGNRLVRYGADDTYSSDYFDGSVVCSNGVFGDPIRFVLKDCEVLLPVSMAETYVPAGPASSSSSSSVLSSVVTTSSSSSSSVALSSSSQSVLSSAASSSSVIPVSSSSSSVSSAQPSSVSSASSSIASGPSASNGSELYAMQCTGCHGPSGDGSVPLTGQCNKVDCGEQAVLADYIDAEMPVGGIGNCVGQCAEDIAEFIVTSFQANGAAVPLKSGSWNVDLTSCDSALPGASQRLLPSQIATFVASILGLDIDDLPEFPGATDQGLGFTTNIDANFVSKNSIRDLVSAAEETSLLAIGQYATLAGCPTNLTNSCALNYIRDVANQLYRGVYASEDITVLETLYTTLTSGSDPLAPEEAIAGVVSAMLQSPAFLYLLELGIPTSGSERILTGVEIANRIALLAGNTLPDSELLAAAERGDLVYPQNREAQAQRIYEQAKTKSMMSTFFTEWFAVDDPESASHVDAGLVDSMRQEFDHLVGETLNDDVSVSNLFMRDTTFVNSTLSNYYGIPSSSQGTDDWVEVNVPQNREAGLLSTGIVAVSHSHPGGTSIIKRGHFIRENLLCQELGTPPQGALEQNPVLDENATVRDYMDARGQMAACGACHEQMDSIGIGMENLDQFGLPRTNYDLTGHPVDAAGAIGDMVVDIDSNAIETVDFDGTSELGAILSSSPAVAMCARQTWFEYAMGRESLSECHAASLGDPQGIMDTPKKLLLDLVSSNRFIYRTDGANRTVLQVK